MKKLLALTLLMSLMTVSCGKSGGGSSSSAETATLNGTSNGTDTTEPSAPSPNPNVPSQALSFKSNVQLIGFNQAQADKYNQAVELVKKVVATEAFRSKVLNYTWNGAKQFANNKGLTNAQIYQSILDAAETLNPVKNNTMDLGVKLYYENSTVIGFTNPSITYINVNTKYFDNFDIASVAGNLFHEWLHKIGYDHDSAATAQRPYSVPYAVGYLVRDLGKNFL